MSDNEILRREEVLQLLSEMAREGSVTAAIAPERALRLGPDEHDIDAELDRILGREDGS